MIGTLLATVLAQSAPPDTSGSDAAIIGIGVLLVTIVIAVVVAKRSKR